jgi:hypothetical protein
MAAITQSSVGSANLSIDANAILAAELQAWMLDEGAADDFAAPKSFTGCVSALSSCAALDHAYTDALKNYGEIYEQFQAYLSPLDTLTERDYDRVIAMSVPENAHFGCLNDDMVELILAAADITDDEIESCGYLGWLHP